MDVEDVQEFCKTLPGVREEMKWVDHLCFLVGDKIFCMIGLSDTPITIGFKTDPSEFAELTAQDHFVPMPYLGKSHWVMHKNLKKLSGTALKAHLKKSHGMIASKLPAKTKKSLGIN